MPEMPEVQGLVDFLRGRATGLTITRVTVSAFAALKTYDPPVDALVGAEITSASRHGKFIDLATTTTTSNSEPHLIFHLAKAGWLRWYDQLPATIIRPGKTPIALRVALSDGSGFDLTEAGTKKSLAVYVVNDPQDVPGIARLGPDPLEPTFTRNTLAGLIDGRRTQIKGVLRDQSILAGVGNAYSDEILHDARMSPYALAASLDARRHRPALRRDDRDARRGGGRGIRQAARRAQGRQAPRHAGARTPRRDVPGLRRCGAQRVLRRQLTRVLRDVPDRRQGPRGPAPVAPAQIAASHREVTTARSRPRRPSRATS